MGGYLTGNVNLGGDTHRRLRAAAVTAEFFDVLRTKAIIGRTFTADDVARSKHIAVISHRLWQTLYGADANILGRTVLLNQQSFLVMGVMAPRVDMPDASEVWIPNYWDHIGQGVPSPVLIARLAPGIDSRQAQEELTSIVKTDSRLGLRRRGRSADEAAEYRITPLRTSLLGNAAPILLLVTTGALIVLLTVCANIANLLLARVSARQREFAVRRALGASDRDIGRYVLTESLLLSLLAGVAAIPLAIWTLDLVRAWVPMTVYGASEIAVDGRTIAAIAGFALLTAALFSAAPLWSARRTLSPVDLRSAPGATPDSRWQGVRSALSVAEIALALVLLAGAVTVFRTVAALMTIDLGVRGENVLVVDLDSPRERPRLPEQRLSFFDQLQGALRSIPGVEAVSIASGVPGAARENQRGELLIEGEPVPPAGGYVGSEIIASPSYFSAIGLDLVAGRVFTEGDGFFAAKVAVVSESFARRFKLTPERIVGRRAVLDHRWIQVVGVVRDVRLGGPGTGA